MPTSSQTLATLYQWSFLVALALTLITCKNDIKSAPYQDLTHSSKIFNKQKYYRLYLPTGYENNLDRFPVIYFFHGWGGRHFKDDNAKLEYEKIKNLVDQYRVILVMWDGNITEDQPRPYNIGNHENINSTIQMAEYFLELKDHIDATYRTKADRAHRGIIGFSMGGFLSYFISGKYPDLVSAAVNMTGSPEFFVGHPENHTLFPLRYAFKNLKEVNIRFHNSTADELTDLNKEVHHGALWEGDLSYDYWVFEGGHKVDDSGKTEVFEKAMNFITTSFSHPIPKPASWYHYDIYPEFSVWNYQVKTNKQQPGLIYLQAVSKTGFRISSQQWLPDGPRINDLQLEVSTDPIYRSNTLYHIIQYFDSKQNLKEMDLTSDSSGRLHFPVSNHNYTAGIYLDNDPPDLTTIDYTLDHNHRYLRTGAENKLSIQLLNRGHSLQSGKSIRIKLSTRDSSVIISNPEVRLSLEPGQRLSISPEFSIRCSKKPPLFADPTAVKFKIQIQLDSLSFEDEMILPVIFSLPPISSFLIDDGRKVDDSLPILGQGNGNGLAEAGERIMIYVDGRRTRLYSDDAYLEKDREKLYDEALPAKWPDGFTLSSIIQISPSAASGHIIEFMFNYETKDFMPITRKLTWGTIRLKIN